MKTGFEKYNLQEERLDILEKFISRRANELLNMPKKRMKS